MQSFRIFFGTIFFAFLINAPAVASEQEIVGYVETVKILPGDFLLKAKLDTGAKSSSLDVRDLKSFTRNGKPWVKFLVENINGKEVEFERPVTRTAVIKRAGVEKDSRPVVKLPICLGHFLKEAEVNLTQRPKMNYRLLLGRLFLSRTFLVDSGSSFLTKPKCGKRDK